MIQKQTPNDGDIVKTICIAVGIIVVVTIAVVIVSSATKNYNLGTNYFMGVLIAVALLFAASLFATVIDLIKIEKMKKEANQLKVSKEKAIPIYTGRVGLICVGIYVALTIGILECFYKGFIIGVYIGLIIALVIAIIAYTILRKKIDLEFLKNDANVIEYKDIVSEYTEDDLLFKDIFMKLRTLHQRFIERKCESIKLNNDVQFWAIYTRDQHMRAKTETYRYFNYIFGVGPLLKNNEIDISLSNVFGGYSTKDNLFISHYSNLPPYVVNDENQKIMCEKIDEVCSKFFAKIRSRYVLLIKGGMIRIGFSNARFGKHNYLFNKSKKDELTREAVEEITDFLLQLKTIIE